MAEIKIGDKMYLTNQYEKIIEVLVTKITDKRIHFSGSHFYSYIDKNEAKKQLHKTLSNAKEYLIKRIIFKIKNFEEEIKRIEAL